MTTTVVISSGTGPADFQACPSARLGAEPWEPRTERRHPPSLPENSTAANVHLLLKSLVSVLWKTPKAQAPGKEPALVTLARNPGMTRSDADRPAGLRGGGVGPRLSGRKALQGVLRGPIRGSAAPPGFVMRSLAQSSFYSSDPFSRPPGPTHCMLLHFACGLSSRLTGSWCYHSEPQGAWKSPWENGIKS